MLNPSLTLDFQRADSYCRRTARNSQNIMVQICFSFRGRSCRLLGIHNLYYRDGGRYIHFAVSALSRATHHINLRKAAGHTWDQPRKNTVEAIQEGAYLALQVQRAAVATGGHEHAVSVHGRVCCSLRAKSSVTVMRHASLQNTHLERREHCNELLQPQQLHLKLLRQLRV